MTRYPGEGAGYALARSILTSLPKFGVWANTVREFATPHGTIGYRQAAILWALRYELLPQSDITPTGLAAFFRIQPSVVTRALAKLEASGFIERAVDPRDTRVSRILITEPGRAVSNYIEQLYIDDILDSTAQLDDAQIDSLKEAVAVLDDIADDLDRKHLGRTRRGPNTCRS